MSERTDATYLGHILKAMSKIRAYTAGIDFDAFDQQSLIHDAVIRQFQVIGEAAKKVGKAYQAQHPEVPWSSMARMRDWVVHHYFDVDLQIIWDTIQADLPELEKALQALPDLPL